MKLTNRLGLPKPIVSALTSKYSITPNRYSVTTVLKDPTNVVLSRRHGDEVESDVSEQIWALFGQGFHAVLEKASEGNLVSELFLTAPVLAEATLSGRIDLYDPDKKTLSDYKTTSVWKVINNDFEDYRKQLMMYAWLMTKNGYEVEKVEAVLALKDHSKAKARFDKGYPNFPIYVKSWDVTDKELKETEDFIIRQLTAIKEAEKLEDSKLPPCSLEFRWNNGDKFAVKKKGNKRAVRVLDSMDQALEYVSSHPLFFNADKEIRPEDMDFEKSGYVIEVRPGENKRCNEYCSISAFCPFYKELLKGETQ